METKEYVLGVVSEYFGLSRENILSDNKTNDFFRARMYVSYFLTEKYGISHAQVSKFLNRKKCMCIYYRDTLNGMLEVYSKDKEDYDNIESLLKQEVCGMFKIDVEGNIDLTPIATIMDTLTEEQQFRVKQQLAKL